MYSRHTDMSDLITLNVRDGHVLNLIRSNYNYYRLTGYVYALIRHIYL